MSRLRLVPQQLDDASFGVSAQISSGVPEGSRRFQGCWRYPGLISVSGPRPLQP